jgi:hypothetical protein
MSHEWVIDTWITELAVAPRHQARRRSSGGTRWRALLASGRPADRPRRALSSSDDVRQASNKLLQ